MLWVGGWVGGSECDAFDAKKLSCNNDSALTEEDEDEDGQLCCGRGFLRMEWFQGGR